MKRCPICTAVVETERWRTSDLVSGYNAHCSACGKYRTAVTKDGNRGEIRIRTVLIQPEEAFRTGWVSGPEGLQ
jgi:hypothetical protein